MHPILVMDITSISFLLAPGTVTNNLNSITIYFIISVLFCFLYAVLYVSSAAIINYEIANKPIESIKDYFPLL